jgi:type I restriction enzyme S subunit
MGKWKNCTLADLGEIVGGATPSTKNESYYGGDIPWITPKDLSTFQGRFIRCGERNITSDGLNSCSARLMPPHSILFTSRAPIGYVAIAENKVCTNQGFKSIIPNADTDYLFLYYLLVYNRDRIENMGSGTTFKEVSGSVMKQIAVSIPTDIEEQQAIAKIIGSLDDEIENNTAINHHLELMAQAIFKNWHINFERSKSFTEVVQVLGGGTPKTTTAEYWDGSIPFFTPKDAFGLYVLSTEKALTEKGLNNCNSLLYPMNTVFVTARGTVGKLAMAGVPMAMNQSCYALVGNNGYGQYFVYHIALETVEHLKHKASGAVFDAIVTRDFESEIVAMPPIEAVKLFEDKVKPIYEALLNNTNESAHLATLRDTLLPRLMSGELSISDIDPDK